MKFDRLIMMILFLGVFTTTSYAQEKCKVLKDDIAGEYIGPCKKGLANGQGMSKGENKYDGEFKNGLPNGKGTIVYANGGRYVGQWKKGLRHGEGTYIFNMDGKDSIADGNWKADKYLGAKRIKQYEIVRKRSVSRYTIRKDEHSVLNRVKIVVKNSGETLRPPQNINGTPGVIFRNWDYAVYENIPQFPFTCEMRYTVRNKLNTGSFEVEFNFKILEPGDWTVELLH